MTTTIQENKINRLPKLAYGTLCMLFLGLIYAWSVFIAPLEAEFGWVRSETSLIFTISMSFFCLGIIAGGYLVRLLTVRKTLYLSALLVLVGFIASTRIHTLAGIYISYGVICGLGAGMGYNATLAMFTRWYPDKPGFCSGALMMGFGFGSLLLGTSATFLMDKIGWQGTFLLFGAITAVLLALSTHIVSEVPPQEILRYSTDVKNIQSNEETIDYETSQIIRRPSFWLYFFWAMCLTAAGLAVIGNAVPIAQELGIQTTVATTFAGLISVTNGAIRIFFGSVFDILGKRKTMLLDTVFTILAMMILIFSFISGSTVLLVVGFILTGMAYGGLPPITASFANRMYGPKNFPVNFSILNLFVIPAALLGPAMAGSIQVSTASYQSAFYILLLLSILAGISGMLIKKA